MCRILIRRLVIMNIILLSLQGVGWAQLAVGQRLKLTGQWMGDHLKAKQLEQRDPSKDAQRGQIEGRIDNLDPVAQTFWIGPVEIQWDQTTQFEALDAADLSSGRSVEVRGRLTNSGQLLATQIEAATSEPNQLQLIGAVTSVKRLADGSFRLTALNVPVVVSPRLATPKSTLTRRLDDKRPEDQLTVPLFGKPLTIGGELGNNLRYRKDFELADDAEDDIFRLDQELQLEFFYRPAPHLAIFLEGKIDYEALLFAEDGDREVDWKIARGETWLFIDNVLGQGVGLQIGRQNFEENREWWWDEDLDAVRLHYAQRTWRVEFALAEEIARVATDEDRIDPEDVDIFRLLGRASWQWRRKHWLEAFFLYQHDHSSKQALGQRVARDQRDESDASLAWLGIRSTGKLEVGRTGRFDYWLDLAWVVGRETLFDFDRIEGDDDRREVGERIDHDVAGAALDIGVSWQLPLTWRPAFTLGYAVASGDSDPERGTDNAFRQTGLEGNNGRFRGVNRFRYYGELLRPELSNLQIWTFAFGFRPLQDSSVELLYHLYYQTEAADFLRSARIDADPEGESRAIGQEWNVVIGIEEWEQVEIEWVGAIFRAGSAYGELSGELAYSISLKVDINF